MPKKYEILDDETWMKGYIVSDRTTNLLKHNNWTCEGTPIRLLVVAVYDLNDNYNRMMHGAVSADYALDKAVDDVAEYGECIKGAEENFHIGTIQYRIEQSKGDKDA